MHTETLETEQKHEAVPGVTRRSRVGLPRGDRRLTRGSAAGDVVLAYLEAQASRLRSLDPAVRRGQPDSVHQMRVTTRRLRSALRSFRTVLPAWAAEDLRDELKWLGTVLGEARDSEVLSERLRDGLAATPPELVLGAAQARIRAHFAPRQAAAQNAVRDALDSPRYLAILDDLDRLLDDPPLTTAADRPAGRVLAQATQREYERTRRRMHRARRAPDGPAREVALHETRKAAKRARYAAEAAQPVFGRKARRFARHMKAVQSALGDHHDAVNAAAVAREVGVRAHLAGENAFSFGLLLERTHRDAVEYEDRARQAWKRAGHPLPRKWAS